MSKVNKEKETNSETNPENAFAGFNLLKGESITPPSKKEDSEEEEEKEEKKEEPKKVTATAKVKTETNTKVKSKKEEKTDEEEEEVEDTATETEDTDSETSEEAESHEDTETEEDEEQPAESNIKVFAEFLKEKGFVDFKDDEFEDSEEGLEKIWKKSIEDQHNSWKRSYPEDIQKFLEFVEGGGNPRDFVDVYYNPSTFSEIKEVEEDDTELQKHIIRQGLHLSGIEEEEIEDNLQLFEDGGKLKSKADYFLNKLKKYEENEKERLLLSQKELKEKRDKDNKEKWDSFKKGLFDRDEINGFKLTPKLKEKVWDHISKPIDKSGKSQLQINNEKNKDAQYIYALLDYLNFDITKLEKQVKTKVVGELHKKLGNYTDSRTKLKSGRTELQEEVKSADFSAFKTVL